MKKLSFFHTPYSNCCSTKTFSIIQCKIKETSLTMNEASSKYNTVNDSQNIFYRKAFKNRIDFTKRQFSKKLANMHALVVALFFRLSTNI